MPVAEPDREPDPAASPVAEASVGPTPEFEVEPDGRDEEMEP